MTSVFEPVRQARRLWEQSEPQLFIDFEELPDATTTVARPPLTGRCQTDGPGTTPLAVPDVQPQREGRPGPTTNHTNAVSAQSHARTRALTAERSLDVR